MMWLRGCPRCRGDMYRDWDIDRSYRQCLQCGYTAWEDTRTANSAALARPRAGALQR
jgi:predicted nucleic-acid-binding Zn-ribbon protein